MVEVVHIIRFYDESLAQTPEEGKVYEVDLAQMKNTLKGLESKCSEGKIVKLEKDAFSIMCNDIEAVHVYELTNESEDVIRVDFKHSPKKNTEVTMAGYVVQKLNSVDQLKSIQEGVKQFLQS